MISAISSACFDGGITRNWVLTKLGVRGRKAIQLKLWMALGRGKVMVVRYERVGEVL